ncbi:GGDEF domain-containing protein [Aquabacterium sp. J223]|uniref:GGDEF domain-containing protein n=1 Tax=Aquabacterium sp. J223 TaxID=2898431 RepID=UPI0021ADA76A|nr:GGDEF domain-containing protein [Aquabacterium sp. J223]UUX94851.1 GGDEF domain-containing protein [Aquabacterium sp. J223]
MTSHPDAQSTTDEDVQRLRRIADSLPSFVGYYDPQQRLLFGNAAFRRHYGIGDAPLDGLTLREVLGDERHAASSARIARALAGECQRYQLHTRNNAGEPADLIIEDVPDIQDGRVVGVMVLITDITELRQAEAEREASDKRLRTIADNLPVLIGYVDRALKLGFCNATFHDWLGQAPQALVGRRIDDPALRPLFRDGGPARRALDGERVSYEDELPGESPRWHRTTLVPDRHGDDEVVGFFLLSTDETTQRIAQQQLAALASFDHLTGLPNRMRFEERLAEAMERTRRSGRPMALVFLDLDRFKQVNDTFGHAAGDELLRQLAQRLQAGVRQVDTVARLAGDEFVVILEGLHSAQEAGVVAGQLVGSMRVPFELDGVGALRATVSAGVSVYARGPMTAAQLLAQADRALYAVKADGRDGVRSAA